MKISLCKHRFPFQIMGPGDCTGCGITWEACQAELARQEAQHRAGSARPGKCANCLQHRMLFHFQADPKWWDAAPPAADLCARCWSAAKEIEERNDFATFDEVFEHGTDDQLRDFLAGRR